MDKVYSEFEVINQNIKVEGTEAYRELSCIASCKVTKTVKKRIKKCRGVEVKSKPRVVSMAIEMAVHMPRDIYNEINGKNSDLLKENIFSHAGSLKRGRYSAIQGVPELYS